MSFLVATNVVASRPPERRPTGTPHARAKKKEKKIMLFLVATNVAASRPPERRRTGTPHARANNLNKEDNIKQDRVVNQ